MKNSISCTGIRQGLKQQNFWHVQSIIFILDGDDLDY